MAARLAFVVVLESSACAEAAVVSRSQLASIKLAKRRDGRHAHWGLDADGAGTPQNGERFIQWPDYFEVNNSTNAASFSGPVMKSSERK